MEPIKEYSRIVLSLENTIIPDERLRETPSAKDRVSHELEVDLRIAGCEYIQSAGILLKLPQVSKNEGKSRLVERPFFILIVRLASILFLNLLP